MNGVVVDRNVVTTGRDNDQRWSTTLIVAELHLSVEVHFRPRTPDRANHTTRPLSDVEVDSVDSVD